MSTTPPPSGPRALTLHDLFGDGDPEIHQEPEPRPYTGAEELRAAVKSLDHCREAFLDLYTAEELIWLWRAWHAADASFPDEWEERQVEEAVRDHKVPAWDCEGKAHYDDLATAPGPALEES